MGHAPLLAGKVAVVTGAGRGIGRQHALLLAAQGASVLVNDVAEGDGADGPDGSAAAVVAEIRHRGGIAHGDRHSVADWDGCGAVVDTAVERFGTLDIVVNNAGLARGGPLATLSERDFDEVMAVHVKGTAAMTSRALALWEDQEAHGVSRPRRIINTTSSAGMQGSVGVAAYAAAKAAVLGLTVVAALEGTSVGATSNAVSPIAFTRMSGGDTADESPPLADSAFDALHPGASSPVVAYLASDESGWLTGQVLRVEGGELIRMRGWTFGERVSGGAGFLDLAELPTQVRQLFGAHPPPVPEFTSRELARRLREQG